MILGSTDCEVSLKYKPKTGYFVIAKKSDNIDLRLPNYCCNMKDQRKFVTFTTMDLVIN